MKTSLLLSLVMTSGLIALVLSASAAAQDDSKALNELYKSRAEAINAEALNKQANASIINAQANYMKTHAESRKLHQEAREKSAQNDLLETRVFYEKRGLYHTYKDAHRPKSSTPEQYASRAQQAAPQRMAASQLWIKPGYLRWPSLLRQEAYASPRGQVDVLFTQRSPDDSGAGSQNCVDIQTRIDELKTTLKGKIQTYKHGDYLAAKKFLEGLAVEAQYAVDSMGGQLASN